MQEGKPSKTAELVCLFRALEYAWHGEEGILKDKLARHFLSDVFVAGQYNVFSRPRAEKTYRRLSLGLYDWIILRHAFLDKLVIDYGKELPVVLLGAGYDSRGQRLKAFIKKGIYEIDFAATQENKQTLLKNLDAETEHITYGQADFISQELTDILAPLKIKGPALFLWEGVTMYISEEVIRKTIATIKEMFGKGSIIAFDYWNMHAPTFLEQQIMKISPKIMQLFFSEPLTFSAKPERMKEICLEAGGKEFTSFEADQLASALKLNDYKPNKYNSLGLVRF